MFHAITLKKPLLHYAIASLLRCGNNVIMIPVLEDVAQKLDIAPDALWQESLNAYIARELRLIDLDVADLRDLYGVASPEESRERIDSGNVYSHPANVEESFIPDNPLDALRYFLVFVRGQIQSG
ncbi:MAG TPA: hypothetical protein EYP41_05760 [Anaerolineae bacterium]|nr:hypothetical protein [Anaerolineae bacterium]HIP73689.1 hypothetical protein [Anaerolineae bacterium]